MNVAVDVKDRTLPRKRMLERSNSAHMEYVVTPYVAVLPVMYIMAAYAALKRKILACFGKEPRVNCLLGDGLTVNGRRVRDSATTWRALDTVYNFRHGEGANWFLRIADAFYMHIRNAQAPRNRLAMAKNSLRNAIQTLHSEGKRNGEPVRILSLAAGSAQGVIEVVAEMESIGIRTEVFLIDQDESAIRHAKKLARRHNVARLIKGKKGDVINFRTLMGHFQPDIIEMMGLTDYLEDRIAVVLFKKIERSLPIGGFYFTSNVHPNAEAFFLKHVVNWDMIYRTKRELAMLFVRAGFEQPQVVPEPHGIQSFAFARRTT